VIEVDLTALPKGAKVHGARLLVERAALTGADEEALAPSEVFALRAPYRPGGKPALEKAPLPTPPPWQDHFDATEAVRAWAAGKRPPLLYVKSLPKWVRKSTRLEIRFEGNPRAVGGQVTGLKVLHHAGQTFITWKEIEDPFGDRPVRWGELRDRLGKLDEKRRVRYLVYRHDRPIEEDSFAAAALLAEVKPLSGFNVNSWSKERLINQTVFGDEDKGELADYNPFAGWDRDSKQGGRLIIPRFVIPGSGKPIPAGTGLYVHSVPPGARHGAAKAYYAVVVSTDGTASACDYSRANAAGAVVERPAPWEPVLQSAGKGEFGFDFPGRKLFYVTWVAPPLSNRPRYFNWSVHLPPEMKGPAPLNVSFHDQGYSYAKPVRRYDRRAVQIAGHDFDPVSGWYGYHECLGTLRSWREGTVQPYTERRLLAFIDWAKRKWKIDEDRCFTDGVGMGGSGAIHFACKHPERFAYVLNDQGAVRCRDANHLPALEAAWGRVEWEMKNDRGASVWDFQDLAWFVRKQGPGRALPVLSISPRGHTAWREGYPRKTVGDRRQRWMQSHRDFTSLFKALEAGRHMFYADFDWGPTLAILPRWMDVARGPVPVVTHSTDRKVKETADGPYIFFEPSGSSPSGWINWGHRWRSDDAVDEPDRLEMTLYTTRGEVTADVTPRRAKKFRPKPAQTFTWSNTHLAEGDRRSWALRNVWRKYPRKAAIQGGKVTADEHGLITLKGVILLPTKNRIVIHK